MTVRSTFCNYLFKMERRQLDANDFHLNLYYIMYLDSLAKLVQKKYFYTKVSSTKREYLKNIFSVENVAPMMLLIS